MSKYCINCGKNRPMYLYHKDDSKYQIKSNNGKCIECRICTYKRSNRDKGFTHRIDGKFTFTPATKKQIIINFFKI